MAEQLYRRGVDGIMETVTPIANGKAAALSAYLAQGGTPFRNSGRFKKGPMKGKNVDEATAEFERMWATAPDALKEKYASRAQKTDLAPSERLIAGMRPTPTGSTRIAAPKVAAAGSNVPPPKDMSAAGVQKRRMASYGYELDGSGNAVRIGTPAPKPRDSGIPGKSAVAQGPPAPVIPVATTGGDQSQAAMGTPDQQAQVRAMMGEGAGFATAGTNDSSMAAAVAMDGKGGGFLDPTPFDSPATKGLKSMTRGVGGFVASLAPSAQAKAREERLAALRSTGQPAPVAQTALTPAPPQLAGPPASVAPLIPQAGPPAPAGLTPQRVANINSAGGDMSKLAGDDRAFVKVQAGQPLSKAPPAPTTPSVTPAPPVAPAPTMGRPEPMRTAPTPTPDFAAGPGKELTGMSAGRPTYSPATAPRAATQGEQSAAQRMMERDGNSPRIAGVRPTPPPRGPASQQEAGGATALAQSGINRPRVAGLDTPEGQAAAEMRRQAAINRNPGTVNPAGLTLGKRRPLDELVKLQGIGTPTRL